VPSFGSFASALSPNMADAPKPAPKASKDRRETDIVMRLPPTFLDVFCFGMCLSPGGSAARSEPDAAMLRPPLKAGKADHPEMS
jgi:hypothetical protein